MAKSKLYFLFLLLTLSICIQSCSKDDDTSDAFTYTDVENSFKAIEIKPGVQDITLKVGENLFYNFRVIFPDVDLTQKWPLILTLHGFSGGNADAHTFTDCYIEPGLADLDVIIISPNGNIGDDNWETLNNQDQLRILTDLSSRFWPIDLNKIVVTGYSNGGNGSWYYAETQPAIFSAAIPLASGYHILNNDGSGRKIDIPMYVIHGAQDGLFPLDTVQHWVDQTILAGTDLTFVVADSLGHYTPCDYESYFRDAATWLEEEVWQ